MHKYILYLTVFLISSQFSLAQEEAEIIKNREEYTSMEQVIKMMDGKPVYVDVWATWCGPCRQEFKYKDKVDEVLKKHGVEVIYISIDKESAGLKWERMVDAYDLSGNHLHASESLKKELFELYKGNGSISIPWYMIYDESGELVIRHAERPSRSSRLDRQLANVLD